MRFEDFQDGHNFSNSESLCCSDASHQVSAQSDLRFGWRCHLKIFKIADIAAILFIRTEWFYQFYLSMWPQMPPTKFGLKMAAMSAILKIFKWHLHPNRKSDWAETWWEASEQHRDSELLKLWPSWQSSNLIAVRNRRSFKISWWLPERPSWKAEWYFLAILNLYVIKFRFNPTYGLGGDVVWRMRPS